MSQARTAVEQNTSNEDAEIGSKNYQKIQNSLGKEGYREGVSDGSDSIYQNSFDNGYEDGFKVGFYMGINKMEKPSRGKCCLCQDPAVMSSHSENDVRKLNSNTFNLLKQK